MKKKQGFTLIELLAVIVILAIIALIATPMILGVIEKARKGAAENSALGYIDAVEKTNLENMLDGEELEPGSYDTIDIPVKYKGEGPSKGFITMGKDEIASATFCINNYYVTYDGTNAKVEKERTCDEVISIKEPTKEECFVFSNGAITDYYNNEGNNSTKPACPRDVIIPETINGETVTTIARWALSGSQLTSVKISNSVISIGEGAFYSNKLLSVTVPTSVTSIGNYAFSGNQLPDDQAFFYKRNSDGSEDKTTIVSYGGFNKSNVVIPSGVKSISSYAFYGNKLTGVKIPTSVTNIGAVAFNHNLLPDDQAFIYARNSDGSEDKTTIVSYGGAKKDDVIIPNGVKTIARYAFYTNQLTSITMPNSVISIENSAFAINLLTNVTIPIRVTSIEASAFFNNKLTNVKIIGKSNSSAFTTYGASIWGWASGFSNTNIEWNATQ